MFFTKKSWKARTGVTRQSAARSDQEDIKISPPEMGDFILERDIF